MCRSLLSLQKRPKQAVPLLSPLLCRRCTHVPPAPLTLVLSCLPQSLSTAAPQEDVFSGDEVRAKRPRLGNSRNPEEYGQNPDYLAFMESLLQTQYQPGTQSNMF